MKKKLLSIVLAFGMCLTPFAAYAEEATAEDILAKAQEHQASATSLTENMTLNLDGALEVSQEGAAASSFPLTMSGDMAAKFIPSTMAIAFSGSFDISVVGQNQTIAFDMYMMPSEDGTAYDMYAKMDDGTDAGWQHTYLDMTSTLSQMGISSLSDLMSQSENIDAVKAADDSIDYTVTDNGDSYELGATVNFTDFMPLVEESLSATGEEVPAEMLSVVESILSGLVMNMTETVDKDTYALTSMHIDFNGSDLSVINAILAGYMGSADAENAATYELKLNDLSIDADCAYDEFDEITVPEEALSVEAIDVSDALDEAVEEAGE